MIRDDKGEIYAVRYDAVNAMLLNEFLKEHTRNEQQQKQITELTQAVKAGRAAPARECSIGGAG